eukprot:TRINITY_DN18627_c0_g1_i2.p1 TRINITY_DN18627_c0_g1~~TRINITY_DN18627_c0_g1_i2.p1  ORF type:complete len:284 (-),score=19.52 TRINITY_DN18627_c0_g1_i2:247-1098(-)
MDIRPWEEERRLIEEGARGSGAWEDKVPRAYWRGNERTGGPRRSLSPNKGLRRRLVNCSEPPAFTNGIEAYATFNPNWRPGDNKYRHNLTVRGYRPLASQCKHRFRIYAGGIGWSVSLKYMLPCNSTLLAIRPVYYDFFSRALLAPQVKAAVIISRESLCESLSTAVAKGNSRPARSVRLAQKAALFASRDLAMPIVYSYMLHFLGAYAHLQLYSPKTVEADGQAVRLSDWATTMTENFKYNWTSVLERQDWQYSDRMFRTDSTRLRETLMKACILRQRSLRT